MRAALRSLFAAVLLAHCGDSHLSDAGMDLPEEDLGFDAGSDMTDAAADLGDLDACDPIGTAYACRCDPLITPSGPTVAWAGILNGDGAPLPGATVTAFETESGATLDTTITAADGSYRLDIPTEPAGHHVYYVYHHDGFIDFIECPSDPPLVDNLTLMFGLGTATSPTYLDALYGDIHLARDPTRGTLSVDAFACSRGDRSDTRIRCDGDATPLYRYVDSDGGVVWAPAPSPSWRGPSVFPNTRAGMITITATAAGVDWGRVTCPVFLGASETLADMNAYPPP